MLPLLLLAACYEGSDLGELYDSNYRTKLLNVYIESKNSTSAVIDFRLSCAKYGSEIKFYYTDKPNADPYIDGSFITVAKIHNQVNIEEQFSVKLNSLNPDTNYQYVIVSSDSSGTTVISGKHSLWTSAFNINTWVSASAFDMTISTRFEDIPLGAEYGLVIGTDPNVSVDHCLEKKTFGYNQSDDWTDGNVLLKDISQSTTYYFKPYVIYHDKVYYGDINKRKMEELNYNLFHSTSSSLISDCDVTLYCTIELDTHPDEFEYGFELSQSIYFEQATEYPTHLIGWNTLDLTINNLKPDTKYYYRAYIQQKGKKCYSRVKNFKTLTTTE